MKKILYAIFTVVVSLNLYTSIDIGVEKIEVVAMDSIDSAEDELIEGEY